MAYDANPLLLPTRTDIETAAERIRDHVRATPVVRTRFAGLDAEIVLKLECLQHSGSFKPRGAFNRVLAQGRLPDCGIIAASGGNHGAAVAYVARELGLRAEIFVPEIAAPAKIARLRDYGANLRIVGRNYAEALAASRLRRDETGALEVHAYDAFEIIAGQGTLAREFEQQADALDSVLVAVGGGGLIGGIAAWQPTGARIVAVEPERSRALHAALELGEPCDVEVSGVAADSLGARRIGSLAFALARANAVDSVLVTDDAILLAQRLLWSELRVVAEPGGAAALAAVLSGAYRPRAGERVGVVVCGANTDPGLVA